jgi:serine/threonine-protein kinase RsbW
MTACFHEGHPPGEELKTGMDSVQERLELDSRLTELMRVRPWIDAVADRLGFSDEQRFALQLCMEEALANVILHGYRSQPGHPIVIRTAVAGGMLSISVDDQAPPFSAIEFLPRSFNGEMKKASLESVTPGGNGIRLLKRFSGSLSYERLSNGNQLTIAFPVQLRSGVDGQD